MTSEDTVLDEVGQAITGANVNYDAGSAAKHEVDHEVGLLVNLEANPVTESKTNTIALEMTTDVSTDTSVETTTDSLTEAETVVDYAAELLRLQNLEKQLRRELDVTDR